MPKHAKGKSQFAAIAIPHDAIQLKEHLLPSKNHKTIYLLYPYNSYG